MCFRIRILSPKHLDTLIIPIKNIKCPKNAKTHARNEYALLRPTTQVMAELCRLCTDSHNATCVDRHCYPFLSFLCNKLELNLSTESKNKNLVWYGEITILICQKILKIWIHMQSSEIYCPFQRFLCVFETFNILDGYD